VAKWLRTIISIAGLILGIFLCIGGEWLLWDWINSILHGPWIDWNMFCNEWGFPAPFFIYWWTCRDWTAPYDLSKTFLDSGLFLSIVSAFSLGYLARPRIEKLIERFRKQ
jgi:hypothetical protein